MSYLLLVLFWVLFALLHSALASTQVKRQLSRQGSAGSGLYSLIYSLVATVSLVLVLAYQFSLPSQWLWHLNYSRFVYGAPVAVLGFWLMMTCVRKYFLQITGFGTFASKPTKAVLETGGTHRFVRHPLYLGTFILIAGLFSCFPSLSNLLTVIMIIVYTLIGIRFEERKLVLLFGQSYRDYQLRVPMILPFHFFRA